MKTDQRTADPDSDTTSESGCPDCGHANMGYSDPIGRLIARVRRKPTFHCATHDRLAGMQDIRFCMCTNILHASHIVTSDLDCPEVDSID